MIYHMNTWWHSSYILSKKKILTIIGSFRKRSLKLKFKLYFLKEKKIYITPVPCVPLSNNHVKKNKAYRGTIKAIMRHLFVETRTIVFVKLKFVGVGYKAFKKEEFIKDSLLFKLGYCHPVYFRTINKLHLAFLKHTRIFVYGTSYQLVFQAAAVMQSCRYPDPYKGKGILLETQVIQLKQGKKI